MKRKLTFQRLRSILAAEAFAVAAVGGGHLYAQDFQHIAPKQPAKPGAGKVVNEGSKQSISGGDEVLVSELKGVELVSSASEVKPGGIRGPAEVEAPDVPLARTPEFSSVVEPYIGAPVTLKSLSQLTRDIISYYRDHDRPVVNVYVPQQAITSGYVQIVVVESKVEKVAASGAKWFSNDLLRDDLHLHAGEQIRGDELRDSLAWINRNPFLQSDVLMAPGSTPGTTDLMLRTQDRFPLRVYAGYEDSGNKFTGQDRAFAGFNYGNLFGLGQQFSYQYTQDPSDINKFTAHSATYIIPLPWQHQLTFFGSYASTDANLGSSFNSGGINWQVSGRYEIPLPSTGHFTESATVGFDFKRNNNNLLFDVATVSNSTTDVDQFVFGYAGALTDDLGNTSFTATGFYSPGGMSAYNDTGDFIQQRAESRDHYAYAQLTLDRITKLPLNFSWTIRGELQFADTNLLPSEQFGLGGYQTVRGYEEREVNGDNGYLLSTELATPPVSLFEAIGLSKIKDQLQFIGFVDYGGTSLHDETPADTNPNTNLLGVGPGVRYVITPYLSFRFDYGWQLIQTGFGDSEHSRGHVGVVISYLAPRGGC